MTSKLAESSIELMAINELEALGYKYINGVDLAHVYSTERAIASEGSPLDSLSPERMHCQ
jgi:hypothetical protein